MSYNLARSPSCFDVPFVAFTDWSTVEVLKCHAEREWCHTHSSTTVWFPATILESICSSSYLFLSSIIPIYYFYSKQSGWAVCTSASHILTVRLWIFCWSSDFLQHSKSINMLPYHKSVPVKVRMKTCYNILGRSTEIRNSIACIYLPWLLGTIWPLDTIKDGEQNAHRKVRHKLKKKRYILVQIWFKMQRWRFMFLCNGAKQDADLIQEELRLKSLLSVAVGFYLCPFSIAR